MARYLAYLVQGALSANSSTAHHTHNQHIPPASDVTIKNVSNLRVAVPLSENHYRSSYSYMLTSYHLLSYKTKGRVGVGTVMSSKSSITTRDQESLILMPPHTHFPLP